MLANIVCIGKQPIQLTLDYNIVYCNINKAEQCAAQIIITLCKSKSVTSWGSRW